ncbi:MAG: class I SAM-dependent methyltransferase [Hyphomonadaceae bacterium]
MDTAGTSPVRLRADYRKIAELYGDTRSPERIIAHYLVERRLADALRASTKAERENGAYNRLYDTLLTEVYDHPRWTASHEPSGDYADRQVRMLLGELKPEDVFLDIGGGDCRIALSVAPYVAKSIVVDVSDQLVPRDITATNFEFVKNRCADVPVPDESVSFIYSNQVLEHIHPDDVEERMRELYRVLKPGGRYMCRTPNRFSGPHDVSMYFDDVSHGTHMREYSYETLYRLVGDAGFVHPRIMIAPRAYRLFDLPYALARLVERVFAAAPRSLHTPICRSHIGRSLLGITMMVEKPL